MSSLRIGFLDLKPENSHANTFLKALRGDLRSRGFVVGGCFALDEANGRAWAEANQVPYCGDPEELNRHADFFMVLAPSNPEVHIELCRRVFPFGKPTYVDKTFAPSLAVAEEIFAMADQDGAAVQTTSALRYTNVQAHAREVGVENILHMIAWGGGRSFKEYAIHPTELIISCMGPGVESVMRRGTGKCSQLLLNFNEGRTGVVNVYLEASTAFAASVTTAQGTALLTVEGKRMFVDTTTAILDFFERGRPNIDREESLAIRRVLDVAEMPEALKGFVEP